MIPLIFLIDVGNIFFFIANFPQIIRAFKDRKNLSGLSTTFLSLLLIGFALFSIGNYSIGANIGATLNVTSIFFFIVQLYWKQKYKSQKKLGFDEAGWYEKT